MELQGRKYDLIQTLVNSKDLSLLQKLESVVQSHEEQLKVGKEFISPKERLAIEEGIAQLDRGEGIPHEEVLVMIEAKLG